MIQIFKQPGTSGLTERDTNVHTYMYMYFKPKDIPEKKSQPTDPTFMCTHRWSRDYNILC